jgi:hypothetical protein
MKVMVREGKCQRLKETEFMVLNSGKYDRFSANPTVTANHPESHHFPSPMALETPFPAKP